MISIIKTIIPQCQSIKPLTRPWYHSTKPWYHNSRQRYIYTIDGHICWNSKRRMPLTICKPRKTNLRFPFAENKQKLALSIFRLQQINGSSHLLLVPFSVRILYIGTAAYIYIYIDIYIYLYLYLYLYLYKHMLPFQTKKWKPRRFSFIRYRLLIMQTEVCRLSVCLRRKNRSYPLANGLNGLNGMNGLNRLDGGLAHLWSISDHETNVPDRDTTT
jgi:hypothetical protein